MDLGLDCSHPTLVILNDFGWQLLQNLLLSPPQDKRGDSLLQALERCDKLLGVFELLLHLLDVRRQVLIVHLVECRLVLKKAWHQEVEKGPEFTDPILKWSATKSKFSLRLEHLNGLGYC